MGNIYRVEIMNKFVIELMGQAWIACLNYLKNIKIEMVLKGQLHTTTTIYGSNTTSTRQENVCVGVIFCLF